MSVYEHDDQGLRVIGYNHGIFFYDPTRNLKCELYLKPDGTLGSNCVIVSRDGGGGSSTAEPAGLTGIGEGPGVDVVKFSPLSPTIGLGGDTILLYDSGGAPVAEFAATDAGLTAALAAATAGDVVLLPAGTISGNHTIPADVTVVGMDGATTLSGTITVNGYLLGVVTGGFRVVSRIAGKSLIQYDETNKILYYLAPDTFGTGEGISMVVYSADLGANPEGLHTTFHGQLAVRASIAGTDRKARINFVEAGATTLGDLKAQIEGGRPVDGGAYDGYLAFRTRCTVGTNPMVERMRITNTGQVGIGIVIPTEALHVVGNILATGQLRSSVAIGTAPLTVVSTTLVSNLNADKWDSLDAPANAAGGLTNNGAGVLSWVQYLPAAAALDDLSDVNAPAPNADDVLTWDSVAGKWVAEAPAGGALALDGLTDVNAPAPNADDVLTWDSVAGEWIAKAPPAGGVVDADDVTYTPTTATDWDGDADPGSAMDAFDQLAERVDDLEAGGGNGDSTHTAAYASRPAASNAGDLFLPSDGFVVERDTGAAWVPWGPMFPFTAPVVGDFAWINQGGATADTTYGGVYLYAPTSGATFAHRILKKAAPSTPYSITGFFMPHYYGTYYHSAGLCWRQSSDGKIVTVGLWAEHSAYLSNLRIIKWTDANTYSADYLFQPIRYASPIWWRITDNGTNRVVSLSNDGQHFIAVHSVGRTDFLTADEVGFFVLASSQSYDGAMTLLSWGET